MPMDTAANRPLNALRRFFDAYLVERDADKALRCVAPSFHWIGTGAFERTVGRAELRRLMEEDVSNEPEPYVYTFNALHTPDDIPFVGGDAIFTKRLPDGQSLSLETRCSALCGEDGLLRTLHLSVPNAAQDEGEFFPMRFGEKALDELSRQSRKNAFDLLKNSLSGGLIGGYLEEGFPLYFVNDDLLEHLGYTYEEFLADTGGMVGNGIHPEDREYVNGVVAEALAHDDHYEVVYRMLRKGGDFIWVQDRGCVSETDDGRRAIVSIVMDITAFRRLQERLEETVASLERQHAEIEAIHNVIFNGLARIVDDAGLTLLSANDQYYGLTGYGRGELAERFQNASLRLVHPDDRERLVRELRARKADGRFSVKFRIVGKGGGVRWTRMDACRSEASSQGDVLYCFFTDIDEQERRDAELIRQQYFMSLISSSIAGGSFIAYADADRELAYVSDSLLTFLGYDRDPLDAVTGNTLFRLVHPDDREHVLAAFEDRSGYYEVEYRIRRGDGSVIWVIEKGRRSADDNGRPIWICILLDITARRMRQEELLRQTRMDPLTELYNRDYARQYIQTYLDIHRSGHASALLIFDLDNFKQVNDRHGHLVGDTVLTKFGAILRGLFGNRAMLARIGGDEFMAFIQDVPSERDALRMAERVDAQVRASLGADYADCRLSVSIGVAYSQEPGLDYETFFGNADAAMYRMKFRNKSGCPARNDAPEDLFEKGLLFRSASDFMLRVDLDTGVYDIRYGAHAVRASIPVHGQYETLLKRDLRDALVPEDRDDALATADRRRLLERFERGEEPPSRDYRVFDGAGRIRWISVQYRFVRGANRRIAYMLLNDVTEGRRQQEQLRVAELYSFMLRDCSDEIYELNMARNRYRTLRSAERTLPLLPNEGTVEQLQSTVRDNLIHPDERRRFDDFHFRSRSAGNGKPCSDEFRCLARDGSYRWVTINVLPVDDPDRLFLVCVMDIDDRKRLAELARTDDRNRLHEERLRLLAERTGSVAVDCDCETGTCEAPYLDALFELRPGTEGPPPLRGLIAHPEDRLRLSAFFASLDAGNGSETVLRLKRRNGTYARCRIAVAVIRDENGQRRRVLGTVTTLDAQSETHGVPAADVPPPA